MEYDEIRRYLNASIAHSVTIDVQEIPAAPGNLRVITIHSDNRVTIEFQRCCEYLKGDWESGGLKYVGQYKTLEDATQELEKYLETSMREWRNCTRERYAPLIVTEPDTAANVAYFEGLVREGSMLLPACGDFLVAGIYWRHIQRYGSYRPDKLMEEQELSFRERRIDFEDE